MNNDLTIRRHESQAAQEIKASAHYAYRVNGITLDGSKFAQDEFLPEGLCLARNKATGLYEKYADVAGAFPTTHDDPVILDESIKFKSYEGSNPNITAGQVLVHGAVYEPLLTGCTDAFKDKLAGAIRFV